jgi:hypothetical protein
LAVHGDQNFGILGEECGHAMVENPLWAVVTFELQLRSRSSCSPFLIYLLIIERTIILVF